MFSWFHFLSYAVITAATPGPNNLMSMSNAGQRGFARAFPFNLGIWLGFSMVMLLCTFFCTTLSALIPKLKTPMLVIGAAYMLWLAWKTFRSTGALEEREGRGSFASGMFLQFVNPKIYIYGIVSMEVYILPHYHEVWSLVCFALLLAFLGFVFTLLWALFGSAFRLLFSKYARVTNGVLALLLVYCAASLFL